MKTESAILVETGKPLAIANLDIPKLKPGQVLAIEPMLTLGKCHIETGPDGFSIRTCDASWAAHFEHTIIITERGNEIVT